MEREAERWNVDDDDGRTTGSTGRGTPQLSDANFTHMFVPQLCSDARRGNIHDARVHP